MRCWRLGITALLFVIFLYAFPVAHGIQLFDTHVPTSEPLTSEMVTQRAGWTEVPLGKSDVAFTGDACLMNEHLAIVFRKGAKGTECYYRLGEQMCKGPSLVPVSIGEENGRALESFRVVTSTLENVLFETCSLTESGRKIVTRYLLKTEKPFIEVQPVEGMIALRVEAASRHAVLPDPRGGDLVVSAPEISAAEVRFPSENMLLLMADGGNALVMCVWRTPEQRVRMWLDGMGENRSITASAIGCDGGLNVWVAVIAAPQIWYEQKISELNPVKDKKLDWKVPFPALWLADYRRTDGLIDTWRLPIKKKEDDYESFGVGLKQKRTVWASARGTYGYPGYIEDVSAYLRASRFEGLPYIKYEPKGWVVIYPFQKASKTPKEKYTVLDILREALENTPEANLHNDIMLKRIPRDKYPATCGVTEEYEKIFAAKEEKAKKAFLLERLEAMDNFVMGIRSRIEEYMNWKKATIEFMDKEKAQKPQVASLVDEFTAVLSRFDKRYEELKLDERTPAAAKVLIEKVKLLIDSDEERKDEKAKELGRATRTIGGSQDHAIGDFRVITKELRQRAGYRMIEAKDVVTFEFAKQIRGRTLAILQNYFGHEGPYTN